jgi:hypothetical protein
MGVTAAAGAADDPAAEPSAARRLRDLAAKLPGDSVSLGQLVDTLGAGGPGLLLLLLAAVTLIPGIAPAFGMAMCFVALNLILGTERLHLPGWLRNRHIDRDRLQGGLDRLAPRLEWLERRMRHGPPADRGLLLRLAGLASLVSAVLIVLPVPFGNTAPALAALLTALGLVAGSPKAILAGCGATILALILDAILAFVAWEAVAGLIGLGLRRF